MKQETSAAAATTASTSKKRKRPSSSKKDPNAPKYPRTGYNRYCDSERQNIKDELNTNDSTVIERELGKRWKELDVDKKEEYNESFRKDKDIYKQQLKEYNEKLEAAAAQQAAAANPLSDDESVNKRQKTPLSALTITNNQHSHNDMIHSPYGSSTTQQSPHPHHHHQQAAHEFTIHHTQHHHQQMHHPQQQTQQHSHHGYSSAMQQPQQPHHHYADHQHHQAPHHNHHHHHPQQQQQQQQQASQQYHYHHTDQHQNLPSMSHQMHHHHHHIPSSQQPQQLYPQHHHANQPSQQQSQQQQQQHIQQLPPIQQQIQSPHPQGTPSFHQSSYMQYPLMSQQQQLPPMQHHHYSQQSHGHYQQQQQLQQQLPPMQPQQQSVSPSSPLSATTAAAPPASATKTTGKEKKKKQLRDPNAPAKPLSGYQQFCKEKHSEIQKINPDMKSRDVMKELGRLWKSLGDDEKSTYNDAYAERKMNYDTEMKKYKSNMAAAAAAAATAANGASSAATSAQETSTSSVDDDEEPSSVSANMHYDNLLSNMIGQSNSDHSSARTASHGAVGSSHHHPSNHITKADLEPIDRDQLLTFWRVVLCQTDSDKFRAFRDSVRCFLLEVQPEDDQFAAYNKTLYDTEKFACYDDHQSLVRYVEGLRSLAPNTICPMPAGNIFRDAQALIQRQKARWESFAGGRAWLDEYDCGSFNDSDGSEEDDDANVAERKSWKDYGMDLHRLEIGSFAPAKNYRGQFRLKIDSNNRLMYIYLHNYVCNPNKYMNMKNPVTQLYAHFNDFKVSRRVRMSLSIDNICGVHAHIDASSKKGVLILKVNDIPRFETQRICAVPPERNHWRPRTDFTLNEQASRHQYYYFLADEESLQYTIALLLSLSSSFQNLYTRKQSIGTPEQIVENFYATRPAWEVKHQMPRHASKPPVLPMPIPNSSAEFEGGVDTCGYDSETDQPEFPRGEEFAFKTTSGGYDHHFLLSHLMPPDMINRGPSNAHPMPEGWTFEFE